MLKMIFDSRVLSLELQISPEIILDPSKAFRKRRFEPKAAPTGLYLELVPGVPLSSGPRTTLSGLWRDELAFWVTSCSILFLMATSRPFRKRRALKR